jgi:hypothetical protein
VIGNQFFTNRQQTNPHNPKQKRKNLEQMALKAEEYARFVLDSDSDEDN